MRKSGYRGAPLSQTAMDTFLATETMTSSSSCSTARTLARQIGGSHVLKASAIDSAKAKAVACRAAIGHSQRCTYSRLWRIVGYKSQLRNGKKQMSASNRLITAPNRLSYYQRTQLLRYQQNGKIHSIKKVKSCH